MNCIKIFFVLILLFSSSLIYSQPANFFISGKLLDKETDRPIEYASIGITRTNIGSASNKKGEFSVKAGGQFKNERIRISCIGYITQSFSIDSVLKVKGDLNFYLSPHIELLDEIVVKEESFNPAEFIKLAVESMDKNYTQQPFNLELFSVIDANDSVTGKQYQAETVMLGYYEGYKQSARKKFEILQKRTTGEDPLVSVSYGYWPSFEVIQADLLTAPAKMGVFNLTNLDQFTFRFNGVTQFEDDTVYHIDYDAPKPTSKITGYGNAPKYYKGSIYITIDTHAVVRHEIITDSFEYHIIYKRLEDAYYPYYFSGKRTNDFRLPGGKRKFVTYNTVTVENIILDTVTEIPDQANEFNIHQVRYDETFWNSNYPVKLK